MYNIVITSSAEKDLRRLDRSVKKQRFLTLPMIRDQRDVFKIKSEEGVWRIRVGEYRIAYMVDDQAKVVTIIRVGPRGDFYN